MKKFLIFLLTLAMVPIIALADLPDISGLTYDELVELKNQIDSAIWASGEWQSVTVPAGLYKIGKDIPAGKWHIESAGKNIEIYTGAKLDENKNSIAYDMRTYMGEWIYPGKEGAANFWDWELTEGYYFEIWGGSAVFTPYVGPSFTFK